MDQATSKALEINNEESFSISKTEGKDATSLLQRGVKLITKQFGSRITPKLLTEGGHRVFKFLRSDLIAKRIAHQMIPSQLITK